MYQFESSEQLKNFIASEVVETSEAASLLNCSRQYVDQLVREKKLLPVMTLKKNKLFFRADVMARVTRRYEKEASVIEKS